MTNCTQSQLRQKVRLIRRHIKEEKEAGRPFDRLVCIVMSHGLKANRKRFLGILVMLKTGNSAAFLQNGIMTCQNKRGIQEERVLAPGETHDPTSHRKPRTVELLLPVEELVAMFKHDKLRAMKGTSLFT